MWRGRGDGASGSARMPVIASSYGLRWLARGACLGYIGVGRLADEVYMVAGLIFSRWLHVVTACLVIGGVFIMRFLLPPAIAPLEAEARQGVFLRARHGFK